MSMTLNTAAESDRFFFLQNYYLEDLLPIRRNFPEAEKKGVQGPN